MPSPGQRGLLAHGVARRFPWAPRQRTVRTAITVDTILVTVMLANNEIGTLQPVREVALVCHERGVLFHCDATQAVGKIPVSVEDLGVDLLSFSAHKIYGPKGVGALYVRRRRPRSSLTPLFDGGGHEQGLRSGTVNVPGVVGLARASSCASRGWPTKRNVSLTCAIISARAFLPASTRRRERHPTERLPNTLNLSFGGVDGAALLVGLREIAVSSGSACTSADPKPSHVLQAIGRSRQLADASLRFSLGRPTTQADVDAAAEAVVREVARLRSASPIR